MIFDTMVAKDHSIDVLHGGCISRLELHLKGSRQRRPGDLVVVRGLVELNDVRAYLTPRLRQSSLGEERALLHGIAVAHLDLLNPMCSFWLLLTKALSGLFGATTALVFELGSPVASCLEIGSFGTVVLECSRLVGYARGHQIA